MRGQNKHTTNRRTRLYVEALEARRLMSVYADFNGDGRDDLAIGVPGEDGGAGMVQVLYGSATGLTATGSQSWSQTILGTDTSEAGDNFGAALAGGDFNNDGFTDLAVGVPLESIGTAIGAGAVHFILGSANGLTGSGDYIMHQDINRVRDVAETGDNFGTALAAGDFNNDNFIDLAVGVPGQGLPGKVAAGSLHVFYGGGQGIKPPSNQTFNLDGPIPGAAQSFDLFGFAQASADFNGDGFSDLAISAPGHDESTTDTAGAVFVLYGSGGGITPAGSQLWDQETPGVPDVSEDDDQFGFALAAGDFNNDGRSDLAIGSPGEDVSTNASAGAVTFMKGSASGLTAIGSVFFTQGTLGGGNLEPFDRWGDAIASADFNGDGFVDVAVGALDEDVGIISKAGTVNVIFGAASGIVAVGNIAVTQESLGGTSEVDDRFGDALGVGDFNGDGKDDLAVGTPAENIGAFADAGAVYVGYGATFTGGQTWHQDVASIFDTAETGDRFGGGLDAAGGKSAPNGGSGRQDLAHLITADVDFDTPINKHNKRRLNGGRR